MASFASPGSFLDRFVCLTVQQNDRTDIVRAATPSLTNLYNGHLPRYPTTTYVLFAPRTRPQADLEMRSP